MVGWWKDPTKYTADVVVQQRTYERYQAEQRLQVTPGTVGLPAHTETQPCSLCCGHVASPSAAASRLLLLAC